MGRRNKMRAILQFVSVPGSLIGLVALLAVVGGIETGNLPMSIGCFCAAMIVGAIYAVLWAAFGGEENEGEE